MFQYLIFLNCPYKQALMLVPIPYVWAKLISSLNINFLAISDNKKESVALTYREHIYLAPSWT